jgi:hypothetical protein
MIIRKMKLIAVAVATMPAVVFSFSADARLAANRLAANRLAANTLSDKAKFDLQSVTVGQIVLADGTILTAQ